MRAGPVGGRLAVDQQPLLARLDLRHIARLLAPTAPRRPCLVMEAVAGEPINRACTGRSLVQRLALLLAPLRLQAAA